MFYKKNLIVLKDLKAFSNFKNNRKYDLCFFYKQKNLENKKYSKFYFESNFDCKFKDFYNIKNKINFRKYDFIWFLDDDVLINYCDVDRFFKICKKYDLYLAQPAVRGDNPEFDFLKSRSEILFRIVNFIDMRVPLFKSEFLFNNIDLIKNGDLGLDWVFPKILDYRNVAIIDDIEVLYLKKIEKYVEGKINLHELGSILSFYKIKPILSQYYSHPKNFVSKICTINIKNKYKNARFGRPTRRDNGCMNQIGFQISNRMMKIP